MKFVCTKQFPLDGSCIYPGIYNAKRISLWEYCVEGAQGCEDVNLLALKDELIECGYFIDCLE